MYRLHDFGPSGNCYKVRLALTVLEREFERVDVDILEGASRTPRFLELNPNGRVPVLELDDGRCLAESNAILWYLADGTRLLPTDPFDRAQVLRWMFFEQYSHEPYIATIRFWITELRKPVEYADEIARRRPQGEAALAVMDGHLRDRDWFVGDAMSIADIALYAYTHVAGDGGFVLDRYASVCRWLDRVASQPGYIPISDRCAG